MINFYDLNKWLGCSGISLVSLHYEVLRDEKPGVNINVLLNTFNSLETILRPLIWNFYEWLASQVKWFSFSIKKLIVFFYLYKKGHV